MVMEPSRARIEESLRNLAARHPENAAIGELRAQLPELSEARAQRMLAKLEAELGDGAKSKVRWVRDGLLALTLLSPMVGVCASRALRDWTSEGGSGPTRESGLTAPPKDEPPGDLRTGMEVERLIETLEGPSTVMARSAGESLTKIGSPAVPALLEKLDDRWGGDRIAIAKVLGDIGDRRAVGKLEAVLADGAVDVRTRYAAAEALVKLNDPQAVPTFIAILSGRDSQLHAVAAWGLGMLGDTRGVPALISALDSSETSVRSHAVAALAAIKDPGAVPNLMMFLKSADRSLVIEVAAAITEIEDPTAAPALVEALLDAHGEDEFFEQMVSAITPLGEPLVEPLLKAVPHGWRNREGAAVALTRICDPLAVPVLLRGLKDENLEVASVAATALAAIGEPALKPLQELLKNESDPFAYRAGLVFREWRDGDSVPTLIEALRDENPAVRYAAVDGLYRFGGESVEPLIEALQDKTDPLRYRMAWALGEVTEDKDAWRGELRALEFGDSTVEDLSVEPLVEALGEKTEPFRYRMAWAFRAGSKGREAAVAALIQALGDEDTTTRGAASAALRKIGAPAFEPLLKSLRAEDVRIRGGAAEILGELGEPLAITPLRGMLRMESSPEVKARALSALEKLER